MGYFPEKPKREWTLEPKVYPGAPPVSREAVLRIAAARIKEPPNPLELVNGGLREGDNLLIDWVDDEDLRLRGCRLTARRGDELLIWTAGGWGRDLGGRCLYMPFLTKLPDVLRFVQMLATASGYTTTVLEHSKTRWRFSLETVPSESQRLVAGDQISFDYVSKTLEVSRSQGTVDMNLYRPLNNARGSVVMACGVGYISMGHHPPAIARVLAEANSLQVKPMGVGAFVVVSR